MDPAILDVLVVGGVLFFIVFMQIYMLGKETSELRNRIKKLEKEVFNEKSVAEMMVEEREGKRK